MSNVYIPRSQDARYIEGEKSEFYIASQVSTSNYVRNGGFELGMDYWGFVSDGWLVAGMYGGRAGYIPTGNNAFTYLEAPTDGTQTGFRPAYLVFDAKAGAAATATVTVELCNTAGGAAVTSRAFSVRLEEWTQCKWSFTPTQATYYLRFVASGDVVIDNVAVTSAPVDLHIPMPQAQAIKIFDLSDQAPPHIAAPGLMLEMKPLSDFGFNLTSVVGLGYEAPQTNSVSLPSGEERLLSSLPAAKDFSITGSITDASSANLDRKKAALVDFLGKGTKGLVLAHRRSLCGEWIGDWGFIRAAYTGGLGIQRTSNHSQDISLDFRQLDPYVYYAPTSLNVESLGTLYQTTDPTVPVSFSFDRYTIRYRGQPYRSLRHSGSGTIYSTVEGGGLEDAEGRLWVWGKPADVAAYQLLQTPSATTRFVFAFLKNTCIAIGGGFTHGLSAEVRGALALKNGDVLLYGGFSSPGTCLARYDSRTGLVTSAHGALTSSNSNLQITKIVSEGTRLWFTVSGNVTFGGVSAGSDFHCASSVFYTDDLFQTAASVIVNPYYGDGSSNPLTDIESDDSGNVYLRFRANPGGTGDDRVVISKLVYAADGTPSFSPMAYMDEDSAHTVESYLVSPLARRAKGVAVPYIFYEQGSSSYKPYILEIADIQNQTVVEIPDNSLTGSPLVNHAAFSDYSGNTHGFALSEGSSFGGLTNFRYRDRMLSGSVEMTKEGKLLPSVARRLYASPNWEIGHEYYSNPYRTLPVQSVLTNPSAVRTVPVIRMVGGGFSTHVGRIVNETNGSSISISGTLAAGEELSFDPLSPYLPDNFVLVENRGPGGVFCLEPGQNSIVTHVNTLWSPYTTAGTLAYSSALRHIELRNLYTYRNTGRVRFTVSGVTLTLQARHTNSLTSYSINLATASTTAAATPYAAVRVLTASPSGGSGVQGHLILYEATYTGTTSNEMLLPLVELVVPKLSLTIEGGTI